MRQYQEIIYDYISNDSKYMKKNNYIIILSLYKFIDAVCLFKNEIKGIYFLYIEIFDN